MEKQIKIALAGNPNCGKTTLFNALTGSNQFVGNWPGVARTGVSRHFAGNAHTLAKYGGGFQQLTADSTLIQHYFDFRQGSLPSLSCSRGGE